MLIQWKIVEIWANMKVQRTYYRRNIGSLNKGAETELLRVIVSYVLNTVIPVFALMKSNRPTFRPVNRKENIPNVWLSS